jgi:branched-chain amino acid transport system substrate-binding protein
VRKFAHVHPDYAYGRNAFDHFTVAIEKLLPGSQVVSQAWPRLGTTEFTPHITTALASGAECLVTSCWGGDYIALYKQGLRFGLFDKMKVATMQGFSQVPHAIGKDHPEGVLMGVHANYFFTKHTAIAGRRTASSSKRISSGGTSIRPWRLKSATPASIC